MTKIFQIELEDRGLITVGGPDRRSFLQGLISNDINRVDLNNVIWAALLTPQGKYLHDFFVTEINDIFHIDCEADRLMDLGQRLSSFKLKAKVDLGISETFGVWSVYGTNVFAKAGITYEPGATKILVNGGLLYSDPRIVDIGLRALLPKRSAKKFWSEFGAEPGYKESYDALRISLGIPDGSRDLVVGKSILLENNFDDLNGIDWSKGCYIGQELTARTKYRGLLKKRLLPVDIIGRLPETGAPVLADGRQVGEIRSATETKGLALIRLEHIEKAIAGEVRLVSGSAVLTPVKPTWFAADFNKSD